MSERGDEWSHQPCGPPFSHHFDHIPQGMVEKCSAMYICFRKLALLDGRRALTHTRVITAGQSHQTINSISQIRCCLS